MKGKCKNYCEEFDCCKVFSDFSDPMCSLQPCIESPCKHYKPYTNFDKITENKWTLAKFIIDTVTHCQFNNCEDCPLYEVDGCSRQEKVKEWLQEEIDDEEDK